MPASPLLWLFVACPTSDITTTLVAAMAGYFLVVVAGVVPWDLLRRSRYPDYRARDHVGRTSNVWPLESLLRCASHKRTISLPQRSCAPMLLDVCAFNSPPGVPRYTSWDLATNSNQLPRGRLCSCLFGPRDKKPSACSRSLREASIFPWPTSYRTRFRHMHAPCCRHRGLQPEQTSERPPWNPQRAPQLLASGRTCGTTRAS